MKNLFNVKTICSIIFICFLALLNLEAKKSYDSLNSNQTGFKESYGDYIIFYFSFHPCYPKEFAKDGKIKIYVSTNYKTTTRLEIPALGINRKKEVLPNVVTEFELTPEEAFSYFRDSSGTFTKKSEQLFAGRSIIIRVDDVYSANCYAVLEYKDRSEGFNVMPSEQLGKTYQVSSKRDKCENENDISTSYTSIVGIYDNTKIDFILGGDEDCKVLTSDGFTLTNGGRLRKTINDGDVWLIPSLNEYSDLSGSKITGTKPFAVISGHTSETTHNNIQKGSYSIEQEMPANFWGYAYYLNPIAGRIQTSRFKVFAKEPKTQVYIDGVPAGIIASSGGNSLYKGYLDFRSNFNENPKPIVISSDSAFPINVVQYNSSGDEDGTDSSPFKLQLLPEEQFKNDVMFSTPGINDADGFDDNYINIVYKASVKDSIPDDVIFGVVDSNKTNWVKLKEYSSDPGQVIIYDKPDPTGRIYYSKTMKLPEKGVYRLRAKNPFSISSYGFSINKAYGFPSTWGFSDLETPDTLAPSIIYTSNTCNGNIEGNVEDEPIDDPENRSNLGLIYVDKTNSFNCYFEVIPFIVGEDSSTTWKLIILDKTVNASAHLVFQDRAGNRSDTIINYIPVMPKILEYKSDFGIYNGLQPPINITKSLTLKNVSGQDIESDKYLLYLTLDSKIKENKMNDINTYQNFDLINVEGINLAPLKKDDEVKFDVIFKGDKFGNFRDSIGIIIINKETNDTCDIIYFTEITALIAKSYIFADDYDFQKQKIGIRSDTVTLKISNPKTDEYNSISDIRITSIEVTGDFVGNPGSGAIFEIDGLQGITKTNPMIIEPGKEHQFSACFKPGSAISYESKISFITEDGVNVPDNVTILKGTGEAPASVNYSNNEGNLVKITPTPANDYIEISSINPMLKHGVDESSDIHIFNILGENVLTVEQTSTSVQRIDVTFLSPGIYFIKIGNRVYKFVKM